MWRIVELLWRLWSEEDDDAQPYPLFAAQALDRDCYSDVICLEHCLPGCHT